MNRYSIKKVHLSFPTNNQAIITHFPTTPALQTDWFTPEIHLQFHRQTMNTDLLIRHSEHILITRQNTLRASTHFSTNVSENRRYQPTCLFWIRLTTRLGGTHVKCEMIIFGTIGVVLTPLWMDRMKIRCSMVICSFVAGINCLLIIVGILFVTRCEFLSVFLIYIVN